MEQRIACLHPDLWLLRKSPVQTICEPGTTKPVRVWTDDPLHPQVDGLVDRYACEAVMRCDDRSRTEAYQAALLCDLIRFNHEEESRYVVYYRVAREDLIACQATIPPLQSRVMDIAFLQSINLVKDPVTKLLNKAINQRCMIRKFGKVALDTFKTSEEAAATLRQMLLVSLLGNYEHVRPSSRPEPAARRWLYRTFFMSDGFDPDDWNTSFYLRLYNLSPHLMLFVLREYLVYAIDDHPALMDHFNTFSDYEKFKFVVVRCMDDVRSWFATNIANESSSLHVAVCINGREKYIYQPLQWNESHFFRVLNDDILTKHHEALLKISYKRPNTTIVSILRQLRLKLPLVKRPGYIPTNNEPDADDDDADPQPARKRARVSGGESSDPDAVTAFDLQPYLPLHQIAALDKVVDAALSSSNNPPQALLRSLDVLECCGIDYEMTQQVKRTIRDMQSGVSNTKQYVLQLKALQSRHPHAYNLLQGIVELLREKQRIRHLCWLPHHYIQNQLKAVKERFGLSSVGPSVLKETVYFVYCTVCDTIYSLLRDFGSTFVNNYGYGLRDAVVEYSTDKLYCKRNKMNHRGRCEDRELVMIPLVGRMLYFQGKTIMLCPQPACGMPMVLDTRKCVWTEAGPSCFDCTFRMRIKRLDYGLKFMTRCARCGVELTRSETIFLYPHGVTLCQRHHTLYPQLQVVLKTPEYLVRCVDRKSTIEAIVEYHRLRKAERMRSNESYLKWCVKRSKMNTRSRKR